LTTQANGKCESFIGTLKHEQLDGRPYGTLEEFGEHLPTFLETVYNREPAAAGTRP